MTIHRAGINGQPECGAEHGRMSVSGVLVTCQKCQGRNKLAEAKTAWASIEAAAAKFQATRSGSLKK